MSISRRRFLETCAASGGFLLATGPQAWALKPLSIDNPLGAYPNRDWEKIYLDQYRYDNTSHRLTVRSGRMCLAWLRPSPTKPLVKTRTTSCGHLGIPPEETLTARTLDGFVSGSKRPL